MEKGISGQIMKNPPPLSLAQKLTWGNREPYHAISEVGNVIKTRNYSFNVIAIPGHASDMIALYEPDKKWLFSADLYINSYIGYFLSNESISTQIESIKNILQLDFKVMFCSHNPQLKNAKKQLSKKLYFLESSLNISKAPSIGYLTIYRKGILPVRISSFISVIG